MFCFVLNEINKTDYTTLIQHQYFFNENILYIVHSDKIMQIYYQKYENNIQESVFTEKVKNIFQSAKEKI